MYSIAKELRFHTKELLDSVSRGEEIIITFRGKPYAKLIPLKKLKKILKVLKRLNWFQLTNCYKKA